MGSVPNTVFEHLLESVASGESAPLMTQLNELLSAGHSPQSLARQMVRYLRNTLMSKLGGEQTELLQISGDERARAARTAMLFSEEEITRNLQIMLRTFDDLNYRQEQRFHLELGLMKLVHAQRLLPLEELLTGAASGAPARNSGSPALRTPSAPPSGSHAKPSPSSSSATRSPFGSGPLMKSGSRNREPFGQRFNRLAAQPAQSESTQPESIGSVIPFPTAPTPPRPEVVEQSKQSTASETSSAELGPSPPGTSQPGNLTAENRAASNRLCPCPARTRLGFTTHPQPAALQSTSRTSALEVPGIGKKMLVLTAECSCRKNHQAGVAATRRPDSLHGDPRGRCCCYLIHSYPRRRQHSAGRPGPSHGAAGQRDLQRRGP